MSEQAPAGYVWIVFPRIPSGKALLHQRDFDPMKHELYVEPGAASNDPPVDDQRSAFITEQLAHTAADVIEKVRSAPADALDVLQAMRAAEALGKNRSTVLAAIDEQIAKLAPVK